MIDVLLITDSRGSLNEVYTGLSRYPELRVYTALGAYEGRSSLTYRIPSVVVLDAHLREEGDKPSLFDELLSRKIPVIIVSYSSRMRMICLKKGAVSFHHQPVIDKSDELASFVRLLAEDIIRRFTAYDLTTEVPQPLSPGGVDIIAVGASTGGTSALEKIVTSVPASLPPMIVTQHMPNGFTAMFASRLDKISLLDVREASDGMRLEKGMCVIAKGGEYMELFRDNEGYFVRSREGEKCGGLCPTVDVMFESAAAAAGNRVLAFLLTGMGADGAQGMLALKRAGAYTVCQDKESCAVYGMPMEAMALGAAEAEMPLDRMADLMISKTGASFALGEV